jgi:DNA uptake protein ComE-like DNA-binding protein
MVTVYSVDANTDANGQQRVNINTARAQQLSQIRSNNNQTVFSQSEANAIIQQREFNSMAGLLDVSAISDQVFNNIRNRITIEDTPEDNNGEDGETQGFGGNNRGNGGNNQGNGNSLININSADSGELQELQGIDNGIANRIIAHRNSQGDFQNIDAIRDVKIMTMQEFAGIVDKITTKDGQTVNGLININTAPLEILQLLPGMDRTKAQAIITRREEENPDAQTSSEQQISGNPFSNIAQLLDIEEIDDQSFREVVDWVTYRSHGYRIVSAGIDMTGKTLAICLGIVVRSGNQLAVQYWRQD